MSAKQQSLTLVASIAVREALTHPGYWLPALTLLSPTLVLQLAAPGYLRTRLAPAIWTVAAGAILLVWLAQVALPAVCALVHARRAGTRRPLDLPLMRLSMIIGTRVTLGLAAIVVPGLWLQARYAFVPLQASARNDGPQGRLLMVAGLSILASALGQSAVAALAEAMGTITAVGDVNGRTLFQLNFLPHAITTIAAYMWNVATVTFHSLCVSALFDEAHGVAPRAMPARGARSWVRVGQVTAAAATLGALAATVYKVHQHLY